MCLIHLNSTFLSLHYFYYYTGYHTTIHDESEHGITACCQPSLAAILVRHQQAALPSL